MVHQIKMRSKMAVVVLGSIHNLGGHLGQIPPPLWAGEREEDEFEAVGGEGGGGGF